MGSLPLNAVFCVRQTKWARVPSPLVAFHQTRRQPAGSQHDENIPGQHGSSLAPELPFQVSGIWATGWPKQWIPLSIPLSISHFIFLAHILSLWRPGLLSHFSGTKESLMENREQSGLVLSRPLSNPPGLVRITPLNTEPPEWGDTKAS